MGSSKQKTKDPTERGAAGQGACMMATVQTQLRLDSGASRVLLPNRKAFKLCLSHPACHANWESCLPLHRDPTFASQGACSRLPVTGDGQHRQRSCVIAKGRQNTGTAPCKAKTQMCRGTVVCGKGGVSRAPSKGMGAAGFRRSFSPQDHVCQAHNQSPARARNQIIEVRLNKCLSPECQMCDLHFHR